MAIVSAETTTSEDTTAPVPPPPPPPEPTPIAPAVVDILNDGPKFAARMPQVFVPVGDQSGYIYLLPPIYDTNGDEVTLSSVRVGMLNGFAKVLPLGQASSFLGGGPAQTIEL